MKAITKNFGIDEAAVMALKAGNNIALMPENPMESVLLIAKHCELDTVLKEHLENSAKMIIKEKKWCGLFLNQYPMQVNEGFLIKSEKIALTASLNAVKTEGDKTILPLREDLTVAGFAFVQNDIDGASQFFKYLSQAIDNDCDFGFIDDKITEKQSDELLDQIYDADLLLFAFFYKGIAYNGSSQISDKLKKVAKKLAREKKTISLFFGNPNIFDGNISDLNMYFYSDSLPSLAAAVMLLSGRKEDTDVYANVKPDNN
jgi:beta-N-acetylhexosaminidase